MKTINKKLAALGVVGMAVLVGGCAESNEKNMGIDPVTNKPTAPGVTPASAPRSSKEAHDKQKSPMDNKANADAYKQSQG